MSKAQNDGAKARLLLAQMKRLLPKMKKAAEADAGDTMFIYEIAKSLKSEIGELNSEYYYSVAKELLIDINDASVPHKAVSNDPINPQHYAGLAVEPITAIEAWGLGFCLGNCVKYIARAGKKTPDALEDLKKSQWYLNREIANQEKKNAVR
jgi:hypothetical protein